jgi:hypothetical protein
METIATIGLDLAKNVFQVHCIGVTGNVMFAGNYAAARFFVSLVKYLPVWLGWRPAVQPSIGAENS